MQETQEIKSISIIGLGNVGWHLSIALSEAAYEIKNVVSRNEESVKALKELIDTEFLTDLDQISEEPDLYLLCVQDSEIESLAASLSSSNRIIAHTSGGIDLSVFSEKADKYGVFYPLQTFTKGSNMLYSDIPFLLEADHENTLNGLKGIAKKISGHYKCVSAGERLSLHLAAVFACNFSNHMVTIADYLLQREGLDLKLILPLMKQTLKKLDTLSPTDAQTGPALRNDIITMNRHLEKLDSDPALVDLYNAISKSIQKQKL